MGNAFSEARGSTPHGASRASCQNVVALLYSFFLFEVSEASNAGWNYMCRGFDPRQTEAKARSVAQRVEQLCFIKDLSQSLVWSGEWGYE
jgi:hypothetical protein